MKRGAELAARAKHSGFATAEQRPSALGTRGSTRAPYLGRRRKAPQPRPRDLAGDRRRQDFNGLRHVAFPSRIPSGSLPQFPQMPIGDQKLNEAAVRRARQEETELPPCRQPPS